MNIQRPTEIGGLLQEALQYHRAGQMQKAEHIYRRVLSLDPDNADANHLLGLIACQFNRSDIGIRLIRKAIQTNPGFVGAHLSLGNVLMSLGDTEGAIACYRNVIDLEPDYAEAHNNLGNALAGQGHLDEAAACFHRALAIKPDYADAYNNLGNLYNSRGDLDAAIAGYRKDLAIKPDNAEAHNNLGTALSNQGDLEGAAACFHKALAVKPDYAEAYNNLGNLYKEQDKLDAAIVSYRKALAINPHFAEAFSNLGTALAKQGDHQGAAASYRKAMAIKPDYAEVYNNMGCLLIELGDLSEAEKSFKRALEIKPDYAEVQAHIAVLKKYVQGAGAQKLTDYDSEIREMETLLADDRKSTEEKIALNFSLGKVFEDLKQYGKAFTHIQAGNRLKRGTFSYDIAEDEYFFQKVMKIFNRQLFIANEGSGYRSDMPIFILGMPRSGSTLIEQILASHPEVHGAGEIIYLKHTMASFCENRRLPQFPECAAELDQPNFESLGRDYVAELRKYSESAAYITNKMPQNFIFIGLIKLILPGAKIIHSLRDPRDTCWSIYKNSFVGTQNYAYDLKELGRYYKLYQELMQHWRSVLPGFIFEMKYEELVADQENQTRRLLEYCELEWHDSCLEFYKTSRPVRTASNLQVRQPLYSTSVHLWQEYANELEPLLKSLK